MWVPKNIRAQDDYQRYKDLTGSFTRAGLLILETSDASASIVDKSNLIKAMNQQLAIDDIEVTVSGEVVTYEDVCVKNSDYGTPCNENSILGLWNYNIDTLNADGDVLVTINSESSEQLEQWLGGIQTNDAGDVTYARALRITFDLHSDYNEGNDYDSPKAEAWEEAFLDLTLNDCEAGLDCYPEAFRSIYDEFQSAIENDLALIAMSYIAVAIFIILNLSGRPCIESRCLLSLAAILTVALGIFWGIGFSSLVGQFYSPLHSILPFIILGIGVDDTFVLNSAFRNTPSDAPIDERLSDSMGHSAVSITVTSLTNFIAFAVSATSSLPALSSFGIYAAFCIIGLYVFQCLIFTACLVLDERRVRAKRADVFPCFKVKGNCCEHERKDDGPADRAADWEIGDETRLGRFLRDVYAPMLQKKWVKASIIIFFATIAGLMAYGITLLDISNTEESFIPDGSYVLETRDVADAYFGGIPIDWDVVTGDVDYFNVQPDLLTVEGDLSGKENSSPYIVEPVQGVTYTNWYNSFLPWAIGQGAATEVRKGYTVLANEAEFYSLLSTYLSGDGSEFVSDVYYGSDTSDIVGTLIHSEYNPIINDDVHKQIDALDGTRSIVDNLPGLNSFPWAFEVSDELLWSCCTHIEMRMLSYMCLKQCSSLTDDLITTNQPLTICFVLLCVIKIVPGLGGVQDYLPRPVCRSGCDPCLRSVCGSHPHFRTCGCTFSGTLCGTHNPRPVSEEMKQLLY